MTGDKNSTNKLKHLFIFFKYFYFLQAGWYETVLNIERYVYMPATNTYRPFEA